MAETKLAKYRSKRDFKKTAEPSGEREVIAAAHRRFVIQKHAATRLHYDLHLEWPLLFDSSLTDVRINAVDQLANTTPTGRLH